MKETICPVCGQESIAREMRRVQHWLAWEDDVCFECEDWAGMVAEQPRPWAEMNYDLGSEES